MSEVVRWISRDDEMDECDLCEVWTKEPEKIAGEYCHVHGLITCIGLYNARIYGIELSAGQCKKITIREEE